MPTNAVSELRQIPFGVLIGGPLKAVVEAQAIAAQTTVEFIQSVGFEKPNATEEDDPIFDEKDPDLGDLRFVTFKYSKTNAEGLEVPASLTVPFLSILPIPLLRIDETIIEFNAKLSDVQQHKRKSTYKRNVSTSASGGFGFGPFSARASLRGSVSSDKTSTSSSRYSREYTMRVYVRAVQDDIPAGLAKVFQILEETIRERPESASGVSSGGEA